MRPKANASLTMGARMSTVCTRALPGGTESTTASSLRARPASTLASNSGGVTGARPRKSRSRAPGANLAAQPAARAFSNSFIFKFPLEHFTMNNQPRSLQGCGLFKLREILHSAKKEAAAPLSRSARPAPRAAGPARRATTAHPMKTGKKPCLEEHKKGSPKTPLLQKLLCLRAIRRRLLPARSLPQPWACGCAWVWRPHPRPERRQRL